MEKWTPLHNAAYNGHRDAVEHLLQVKATVDKLTPEGDSALLLAVRQGQFEVVRLLVNTGKANIDLIGRKEDTALRVALKNNSHEISEFLLAAGANTDI